MIDNAIELQNMDPVAELTGKEFPKSETSLRQRIVEYFNSLGNNVYTKLFGDVALTSSSVHDDLGHGITNNKVVSFAAVPEVLKNGVVIDSQRRGGNNYDRIVVAAPIKIGSQEYIMGVMLQRDHQSQRLYLHDVVSINKEETMQSLETTPSTTEVSKKSDSLYMTNILQRALSVNSKSMQEGENNTHFAKEISEADRKKQGERQEKVKSLCELFGLPLEWDESIKRGKYNPDTRTVFINPNLTLTEMYIEVLKHEFTHDLENRRLYKKFKEYLFNSSENFIKFCEEEINELKKKGIIGEVATGKDAVLIYRGHIYEVYKNSKEMNDKERAEFDGEAAEREMICNFVSKRLLSRESETECIEALKELAEKQRTVFDRFMDLIRNFIYHIKQTFNKATEADELEYLERRLKQVYDSKIGKNKTAQGGEEFSIVTLDNGMSYVQAERKIISGSDVSLWRKQITDFFNRSLSVSKEINIKTVEGDILIITRDTANKARDAEVTEKGKRRKLSDKEFRTKLNAEAHIDELAEISRSVKKNGVKSITTDTKNHDFATDGFSYRTVYFKDFDSSYYRITMSIGEKGTVSTVYNVGQIKADNIPSGKIISAIGSKADMLSADITVPQNEQSVNSNSMQENEKHSIDLEENVSKKEETEEAITETGFSIKNQLENSRDKLNAMDVITSYNTKKVFEYNQQVVEWVVELYEKINYKVTRSGFGEIILDKKRIKKGVSYTKDYIEKIAFAVIPDVLEKGIEIGSHKKHKNRPYDTYTFAAPVEINGMRGNMAVVVRQDGENYYKAHRIVMPDGTQIIIDEKRDTAETAGGVENNSGLSPTDNVSKDSIL